VVKRKTSIYIEGELWEEVLSGLSGESYVE